VVSVKPDLNQKYKPSQNKAKLNRTDLYFTLKIWERVVQRADATPCTTTGRPLLHEEGKDLDVKERLRYGCSREKVEKIVLERNVVIVVVNFDSKIKLFWFVLY
jgi:hypothetical protein